MLAKISRELKMGEYLLLSRGEEKSGGKVRDLLLANSFEYVIVSIYIDQCYDKAKWFLNQYLILKLPKIIEEGSFHDSKSSLQEMVQEKDGVTPTYKVLEEKGPDHSKHFLAGVYINQ